MGQPAAGGVAACGQAVSLRILFAADVPPDPDSGAAGTEFQTIAALRLRGHEVDTIWAGDLGRRIRHGNLHYLLELPGAYRRVIAKRCAQKAFDVLHVNQGHGYAAAREHLARRRPGVFVCRSHGLDDHMERRLAPWRERLGIGPLRGPRAGVSRLLNRVLQRHDRLAYRYASGVLVSSSLDEEYLVQQMGVPPQRVGRVAQAPAAVFCATPAELMTPRRLDRLLHVGGFAYFKGVHAVGRAASQLLSQDPVLRMTWVCRQDEHEQARALLAPDIRPRVEFVAWVTQERLVDIFDSHGIFLMPSLFEGFGKVFLEAMARGMCVIGTPTGGMRDIIEHGRNGMHVDFDDAAGIVQAVANLRVSPQASAEMSRAAAHTARGYSWDRVAADVETFYRCLIAMGPRSLA